MENFLVVKVQASVRQQMIYRSIVEQHAMTPVPAPVPTPVPVPVLAPVPNNHASWVFDTYLSRVHSDR